MLCDRVATLAEYRSLKFLCDRCKTRYSIADERVRGKILKIRCKNCSAVITVREGMEEPAEWSAPAGGNGAAAAAVPASAIAPPRAKEPPPPAPAALQEEWYVSLDGKQEGPFSLPEAQAWVSAKGGDDDLYCWSEGFDDWLPIVKVSHFRGLRGRPAPRPRPPAPPDEPKPLFAATLAALEADVKRAEASAPVASAASAAPATPASRTPIGGTPAMPAAAKGGAPAIPAAAKGGAAGTPPLKPLSPLSPLSPTTPRATPRFDTGDADDLAEAPTVAQPRDDRDGRNGHAAAAAPPAPIAPPAVDDDADEGNADDPPDDDLSIGEVSRVVRLADLAQQVRAPARKATPAPRNPTGAATAIARGTGATAAMGAQPPPADAAAAVDPVAPEPEPVPSFEPPPPARRRQVVLPALMIAMVLAVVAVVVVALSSSGDDGGDATASSTTNYENLGFQVDDPINRRKPPEPVVPDKGSATGTTAPVKPRGTGGGTTAGGNTGGGNSANAGNQTAGTGKVENVLGPDGQPLRELTPDEVFAMSARMEIGTRRCYERALKDDPFLKVSKIKATITVTAAGVVTAVNLSTMAETPLGTCLATAIKRWKFRASTSGIVSEFSLVFEQR